MTWICKNHFDKFPHFYLLSFLCSSAPKDTDSWIFFPRIFFFFCQQHWQSNLNEILHTDIFLTRENSTKWIGTEKGVLTPIIGRFVCDYHHPSQFPLTRLCFMDDRWWTPPLVFHTCRFDIFLTLGHWGRTRWEQDYQILIRGDLSALVSISHNKSAW